VTVTVMEFMLSVLLLWTIFNPLGTSPTGLETMNEGM
jgi:hypothetical protein